MRRTLARVAERAPLSAPTCQHYWVIEESHGPTSRGVCKVCGVTQDFLNSIPDNPAVPRGRDLLKLPKLGEVEIGRERSNS